MRLPKQIAPVKSRKCKFIMPQAKISPLALDWDEEAWYVVDFEEDEFDWDDFEEDYDDDDAIAM
ncbi:hypothetical protein KFU94_70665 [Chloroflexi bacterium TSY]|nr:hypothetical protein [Chloroflexi bacterium TSY]